MLLQSCNLCRSPLPKTFSNSSTPTNSRFLISTRNYRRPPSLRCLASISCSTISVDDIADVLHNKVLVAAAVSAAIGQLTKPFSSVLLYGKKFDLKAAIRAGGFPSTHSSAAVAAATSLALERGFSDAIFGLAAVYASLIMYDAQGVRREVGIHARTMNKYLRETTASSTYLVIGTNDLNSNNSYSSMGKKPDSLNFLEEESSFQRQQTNSSVLLESDGRKLSSSSFVSPSRIVPDIEGDSESGFSPLKESIGHTEIEVTAGALLGFLVSVAICPYVLLRALAFERH